jgi:ABC-type amino acid transport substrate-binding protein/ABC-type amino acid transport system permease subunit
MLLRVVTRLAALAALLLCAALPAPARAGQLPDAALAQALAAARAAVPKDCGTPGIDRLIRILCTGRIRVGVRNSYPLFADKVGGTHRGFEIDVARAIAHRLGVDVVFVGVKSATRVAMLADDSVDLTIATMGHNTQRDGQALFARPHYYQSETILVGPRDLPIAGWRDVAGRTVCATVGNYSNAELISHGARLMLFDDAGALPERLRDETCFLAAQDDSFFAFYFTEPAFATRFTAKFGFAQVPWGMAVARGGSRQLGRVLNLMSQIFHRDGVFLRAARAHHIRTNFLERQQAVWQRPDCNTDSGSTNPNCVLPPLNVDLQSTPFAPQVGAFENWLKSWSGIDVKLPMLTTAPAWSLFVDGVVNSLVLVVGALAAALCFALLFGAALGAPSRLLRWPARAVTVTLQSSPIILTLVMAAALVHAVFSYSSSLAIGAAILALGLTNGSNAGQAISEAVATLRAERAAAPIGGIALYSRALSRSATQIMAFLVNAAKGTPIASFIGAPELLNSLTDITAFSSGRATTYTLLLIFYTAVVIVVVRLCDGFRLYLERSHAGA